MCAVDVAGRQACDTVTVEIRGCTVPSAPGGLASSVSGSTVTLAWTGSTGATSYVIEAGSAAGGSNLAVLETGPTSFTTAAPNGTYYVRVRAKTGCGASAPSNEVVVVVGAAPAPPPPSPPPPPPAPSAPTIAPTSFAFGDQGGCPGGSVSGTITANAAPNVTWTATHAGSSVVSWATLTLGRSNGTGAGSVPFTITWPPQRNTSSTFTCSDVFRFSYGDTISVRFSTGHTLSSQIRYTYLSPY